MANELKHKTVGTVLTQVEFEATDSHAFADQAAGDILYALSTTQLSRLGKGADNTILTLASGVPAWTATPTLTTVDAGTDFTVGTTVITDDVITFTPTASDTCVLTATTNGAFSLVTTDAGGTDASIQITADGTAELAGTTVTLDSGGAIVLAPTTHVFINEDANASMTIGLTINQAANDNEIFALKSSDVSHGNTDDAEADTFFLMKKNSGTDGGDCHKGIYRRQHNECNQPASCNHCCCGYNQEYIRQGRHRDEATPYLRLRWD